jgi:hypothetical protein
VIRFRPFASALRKLGGQPCPDLTALARDRWEVSPSGVTHVRSSFCIPSQIERVRATEFGPKADVLRVLQGGFDVRDEATMAYRLTDVDLIDGVLFGSNAQRHLTRTGRRRPAYRVPSISMSGAMYESWNGNRWFGTWLHEDCLTYRLAELAGRPVTTAPETRWSHGAAYEALLGMAPRRVGSVHFDELILFDDEPNNAGKAERARDMRERLLAGRTLAPVPGVFLLRGDTGARRAMLNERAVAERLAEGRGFLVLDPTNATVDEIAAACGRARVVMGIEGSQLVHGAVMMPPDALLFVIQPPDRTCAILKSLTDRQGQDFAFIVGQGGLEDFSADWDEIRQTLDLAMEARQGAF